MKLWVDEYNERLGPGKSQAACSYLKVHEAGPFTRRRPDSLGDNRPQVIAEHAGYDLEAFVATISNARVIMRTGVVISPDDRVFEQSCSWGNQYVLTDAEFNSLRSLARGEKLPGAYATIISRSWQNYFHWFAECLTRICVLDSAREVPILLPSNLEHWHKDSLVLLGIEKERWIRLDESCYEVDQLVFPSFPGWTGHTADWALCRLREKLLRNHTPTGGQRLYVGRVGTAHRRVTNEGELIQALEREGFTVFDGKNVSFEDELKLFANADMIVGVHGAGMTNIVAARPGTKIIEIFDPLHFVESYCNLTDALGLRYWYMFAENESVRRGLPVRKGYDDICIPIESTMRAISHVLAQ